MENTVTAIPGYDIPMPERLKLATERGNAYAEMLDIAMLREGQIKAINSELLKSLSEMLNLLYYYTPDNGYIGEEKEAIYRARVIIDKGQV